MMNPTRSSAPAGVYCNPLDLAYRFQDVRFSGVVGGVEIGPPRRSVHREAADPSVVRYRGRYFLFASMSAGFWHSDDLVSWNYRPTEKLPPFDYAPDVREVNGALLISASRKGSDSPFFRSDDPLADDFTEVSPGTFAFWDPSVFQDDDGRIYLYWGCDNVLPISGVELDSSLRPIGEPVALIAADDARRGWERTGEDYVIPEPKTDRERKIAVMLSSAPYLEGAWMTRLGGTYYLQYAAPGTQLNTYADGYFISESALGPFRYSEHSPFSSKPGGFATGAGHGSTFQDEHGNWWHAATMRISVNDVFERRVGIFPAGFDEDGVLFSNQNFGDYPAPIPSGRIDPWERIAPEWMLLSYRSAAIASSAAEGHSAGLVADEDIRTWWASEGEGRGEWVAVDLAEPKEVHAIQVNLADHETAEDAEELVDGADGGHTWRGIYRHHDAALVLVEGSADGETWDVLHDGLREGADRPHALIELDEPRLLRHVRVTAQQLPFEGRFAVSGLRVFGVGAAEAPASVSPRITRPDPRTASLEWDPVPGAIGYNVRYGLAPEKLYHSWLVYDRSALDVGSLNAGHAYWFAVDSFNEGGVTAGSAVRLD